MRNGLVREVERGKVLRTDVCDAHPELLRAARNVGRPTKEVCPACAWHHLMRKYPAGGGKARPKKAAPTR